MDEKCKGAAYNYKEENTATAMTAKYYNMLFGFVWLLVCK